jgi:hypothetical protein
LGKTNYSSQLKAAVILLSGGMLLAGAWGLYSTRYRGSDIYPAYSSFRTDRMGTKLLYESLNNISGYNVKRNFRPLNEMRRKDIRGISLFVAGSFPHLFDIYGNFKELNDFVLSGGRAIVSFTSLENSQPDTETCKKCGKAINREKIKKAKRKEKITTITTITTVPEKDFGVKLCSIPRALKLPAQAKAAGLFTLPSIQVYSKNYFKVNKTEWKILFTLRGKPVIIERQYPGGGSLVLCADSYFFSNQNLAKNPGAKLLLYLIGRRHNIIFDETHLGAIKELNVVYLAKKYNLYPFIMAAAATLLLFVWRSLSRPCNVPDNSTAASGGKDSINDFSDSSLVNMLKSNYSSREVMQACWDEFKAGTSIRHISRRKYGTLKNIVSKKGIKPVEQYNEAVNEYIKREGLKND